MTVIRFSNIGRQKATWEARVKALNQEELYNAINRRNPRPLMSQDISFTHDDETGFSGAVLVGGDRCVGQWEIVR